MTFADIWDVIAENSATASRKIKKSAHELAKYDREDYLAAIGLEPKRGTFEVMLPALGFFSVGILAGVGLGMLFAPKPGYELREEIGDQMKSAMNKAKEAGITTGNPMSEDVNPVI